MVHTERKKVWSCNKFKKMKCPCNRWVLVRNPDTPKEIVQFVHEVRPVFAATLSTLNTCYLGEIMIACQVSSFSEFFCSVFQFQGHLAQNKAVNAWKIENEGRKGWKLMTWLWMLHAGCKRFWSCNKLLKFWIAGVTDEFSSETLILRKRLSSLYTKCIQFCRDPLYFFAHAMRVKWWHHAKFQSCQCSFCSDFQFHGHLAL